MVWLSRKLKHESIADQTCREDDIPNFVDSGSIGDWFSRQAEYFTLTDPNDDWAKNIIISAQPDIGDDGLSGCGVIGSQWDPDIDCVDLVRGTSRERVLGRLERGSTPGTIRRHPPPASLYMRHY